MSGEARRQTAPVASAATTDDRPRVAVVGAGLMGRGIAENAATAGSPVVLYDNRPPAVEQAIDHIRRSLDRAVARGRLDADRATAALSRVAVAGEPDHRVGDCDVVVEAVVEDAAVKAAVFEAIDALAGAEALLATNTSALSVTELAAVIERPDRLVGMHFFNPVPRMQLVEVVRGRATSDATLDAALRFAAHLGKEPVVVNDSPGFVTTRVNAVIGNEAFRILAEGVATPEHIDRALKLGLNHPMGPFELVDLVGLDTRLHVLEHLHETLGDFYRPAPLLRQYVAAGRLGRKTGRGVYEYEAG